MPEQPATAVVTGATSGIGRVLARRLAESGFRVVIVGRDRTRCNDTLRMLSDRTGRSDASAVVADLATLGGAREAARQVLHEPGRLSLLVNNAGAIFQRRLETPDGLERTFALNVLAPYVLTRSLEPALRGGAPSRVVMTASAAHRGMRLDLDDLQGARHYSGWGAYGRSKLALILLTREFARRWAGSGITINAVHPGFVRTNFGRENPPALSWGLRVASLLAIGAERGADTPLFAATSPELAGTSGEYLAHRRILRGSPASNDAAVGDRLWAACGRLAGWDETEHSPRAAPPADAIP